MFREKFKKECRFERQHRRPLVFAITIGMFLFAACEEQGVLEEDTVQSAHLSLNAASEGKMWPGGMVPVCWESRRHSTERQWVEDAVRDTWEATGNVFFSGWERCPEGWVDGIRIAWDDVTPESDIGISGGVEPTMTLNLTFDKYYAECRTPESKRRNCIEVLAVHEFGHAIGFFHEHARIDTPLECQGKESTTGRLYTDDYWDRDSVMNYCNPDWKENFPVPLDEALSTYDIQGTRHFYPHRQGDGFLPISQIAVSHSSNGRLSLFARMGDKIYHKQQISAGRSSTRWPATSTNPWSSWDMIGHPHDKDAGESIAAARHTDGRVYVFVTQYDGQLHYAKQTAVDSSDFYWSKPGLTPVMLAPNTQLAAANYPDGGIAVFGRGPDGKLTAVKRTGYYWSVQTLGNMEIGSKLAIGTKPDGRLMAFTTRDGYFYSLSQNWDGSWTSNWSRDWTWNSDVSSASAIVSGTNSRNNLQVFFVMAGSMAGEVWSVEYANGSRYYDRIVSPGDVCVAGVCSSRLARSPSLGGGRRSDGRLVIAYYQDRGINIYNRRTLYVEEQANGSWSEPDFFPTYGQSAFAGDFYGGHTTEKIVCTNYSTSWNKLGCFSFLNRGPEYNGEYYVTAIYEKSSMTNGYTPWFFLGLNYSYYGY